ncbi:MAG: hypothetical protein ABI520_10235 [Caldimonas sp.]
MSIPEAAVVERGETSRACFGVACGWRSRCARYAAVDGSNVDPQTLVTCAMDETFPMFIDRSPPGAMKGRVRGR